MNKKKNPDDVRDYQVTTWLNKKERLQLESNLAKTNGMRQGDFMREQITRGYVHAYREKSNLSEYKKLIETLLLYRSHFSRLSNLIRSHDTNLHSEIRALVTKISSVIEKV